MTGLTARLPAPTLESAGAVTTLGAGYRRSAAAPHRSFDPRIVGELECAAWVAYYRRDWWAFVRSAVRVSRRSFGLSWKATIHCSWLVLRANQHWAPFPDNAPERSRRMMERFYRIVQRLYAEPFDPATAAELEVEWWRVHRDNQRSPRPTDGPALADALARLYAHVYGVAEPAVRPAAEQRALAMRYSDQWVREGCHPDSMLIDCERDALVRSYVSLLGAVRSPERQPEADVRVGSG